MIQWLRKLETLETTSDIWKDISTAYWKHNGEQALRMVKEWAKGNPRLTNYVPDPSFQPFAGPHQKKRGKGKKKASDGENLLHTLTLLIAPEEAALAEALPVRNASLEEPSDDAGDAESSTKRQKLAEASTSFSDIGESQLLWHYTGVISKNHINVACQALGVKMSNSNQKSIAKLEEAVNTNREHYYNDPDLRKALLAFGDF